MSQGDDAHRDAPGRMRWWPVPGVVLFNILVHVLTETNRHAGHADILREQLDGPARMTRRVYPFTVALAAICATGLALGPGAARGAPPPGTVAVARPAVSLVTDLAPGRASSDPRDLTAMNGTLFFLHRL